MSKVFLDAAGHLFAQQARREIVSIHADYGPGPEQVIYLCHSDIAKLYLTYCMPEEREDFLRRKWGRDPAHPK